MKTGVFDILMYALAVILGIVFAFIGVFTSLFADSSLPQRLIVQAVVVVIYAVLGAVFGYFMPRVSWKWGVILSVPAILFFIRIVTGDPNTLPFIFLPIAVLIVSCLSSYFAARYKTGKGPHANTSQAQSS